MIRRALTVTALVTLTGVALVGTTGGGDARSDAGPAEVAVPLDPIRALVEDPNGPREIEIPAGVHRGDLVVKRPLVLRGAPGAVLSGSGGDTVLAIESDDVVIEGLTIRRSGRRSTAEDAGIKARGARVQIRDVTIEDTLFGVILAECRACSLERVHVVGQRDPALRADGLKLWESHDSTVRDCVVEDARDVVVWYSRRVTVEGNRVRGSRYGAHFMYAHDAIVRHNRFESNVVGLFVMYSMRLRVERNVLAGARGAAGIGVGFKDSDAVDLTGNWLVANTTGTYLDNTPRTVDAPVRFEGNVLALNDVAVRLHGSEKGLSFHGNELRDNASTLEVDGGGNALGVDVRGNHFTDYEGYDFDGDGVGDVAYEVKALSSELTESYPSLRFFHGTTALGVVDAIARAMPVFAAKKLLVDPAPLVRSPDVEAP